MSKKSSTDSDSKKQTSVRPCGCKHPMQDLMHGAGRRTKNRTKNGAYRCTVCGKVE